MTQSATSHAPATYHPCEDLWVVTAYFNPAGYERRLSNYKEFAEELRQSGIPLLTVECALGNIPHVLREHDHVVCVRSDSALWHKERLLNIGVSHVPPGIHKIGWLDCDLVFENPNWAVETSRQLDEYPVAQPFQNVFRLRRGEMRPRQTDKPNDGFAYVRVRRPAKTFSGIFGLHGHTGFGWAARREVLEPHGLYDACISGGADHAIAHAMCADFDSPCVKQIFSPLHDSSRALVHFRDWAERFYDAVQGRIGYASGRVLHKWHGDLDNRKFVERYERLSEFGFDPNVDLAINESGAWEWRGGNERLRNWLADYFLQRNEDGR